MNTQLIKFSEKMKALTEGNLRFYTCECSNGFNQAILEHSINGNIVAVWMTCDNEETNYLIDNFSELLKACNRGSQYIKCVNPLVSK